MKHLLCVLVNGAAVTCRAEREAVEATEQRISGTTVLTGGGPAPSVQGLVFEELVSEFVVMLEPLLEVGLMGSDSQFIKNEGRMGNIPQPNGSDPYVSVCRVFGYCQCQRAAVDPVLEGRKG